MDPKTEDVGLSGCLAGTVSWFLGVEEEKMENSISQTFVYDNEGAREETKKMEEEEKSQHGSIIKKIAFFNKSTVKRRSTTTLT